MGTFSTTGNYHDTGGNVHISAALIDVLTKAAAQSPYNVVAFSGVAGRSSGSKNHPKGTAVDIYLQDPSTGKYLTNYAGKAFQGQGTMQENFPAYETFAQTARVVQQQTHPELDKTFRWGGYFSTGKANKSGPDLMHFDVNPSMGGAMGKGSWDKGLTDSSHATKYGLKSNGGLTNNATLVAQIKSGTVPDVATAYVQPRERAAGLDAIDAATAPKAPVPMPGRPGALAGPQAVAPMGGTKITVNGGTPEPAKPTMVRTSTGKLVATGIVPSSNPNHSLQISDDGHGNAVITHLRNPGEIPGVIDPLNEPKGTIAGGIVQRTIQDIKDRVQPQIGDAVHGVQQTATDAAAQLAGKAGDIGNQLGGMGSTIGSAFSGLGNIFAPRPASPLTAGGSAGAGAGAGGSTNVMNRDGGTKWAPDLSELHSLIGSGGQLEQTHGHLVSGTNVSGTASLVGRAAGGDVRDSHGAISNVQTNVMAPSAGPSVPQAPQYTFNPAVQQLQQHLGIKADGFFGPATAQAVRTFQTAHGLTPDGVVGPKTLAALSPAPVAAPAPVNHVARPKVSAPVVAPGPALPKGWVDSARHQGGDGGGGTHFDRASGGWVGGGQ